MINRWAWCGCFGEPRPFFHAVADLVEEIGEFMICPSLEEASDIVFATGRLLGSMIGRKYISLPGDSLAIDKFRERMMSYQCVRSRRYLVGGRCPTDGRK